MKYAVYGTVYNNGRLVLEAVKSISDPSYEIVIVDGFSTDGTYEKLLDIRKDFNLTVLRARVNRGLGRQLALKNCPSNSRTAYVDLDAIYNENFHRLMKSDYNDLTVVGTQNTYFGMKETILNRHGWMNLAICEDWEFLARMNLMAVAPTIIARNQRTRGEREKRYASGIPYLKRIARIQIDGIRGAGLVTRDINPFLGSDPSMFVFYIAAKVSGIYRRNPEVNNIDLVREREVNHLVDPRDLGVSDDWVAFSSLEPLSPRLATADSFLPSTLGRLPKYAVRRKEQSTLRWYDHKERVVCARNFVALKRWLDNFRIEIPFDQLERVMASYD